MSDETGKHRKILSLQSLSSEEVKRMCDYTEMSFDEYLHLLEKEGPEPAFSAHQRLYYAIMHHGEKRYSFARREYVHYKVFDDPFEDGKDAVYGLDKHLMRLVRVLKAAAARLGQEQRIILLHGPVGSAKSTIARLLRKALVYYSQIDEGKLFTFSWIAKDEQDRKIFGLDDTDDSVAECPLHEEPLLLLPNDARSMVVHRLNQIPFKGRERPRTAQIKIVGELCPRCRFFYRSLMRKYRHDGEKAWKKVLENHILVRRIIFSEADRIGIGSFRPKDEKNQDSMELTGDINYRKIAKFGSESDPRAFNYDGEYQIANRGFMYFEEALKLDKAFLYDLLGATQEHVVKPKRSAEMFIDEVLMAGTNNPEVEKLSGDETMEAFRDRMTRVPIPYVLKLSEEEKVYHKVYKGIEEPHIAPHTIEMASLWSVLTRLLPSKLKEFSNISLRDKARLYNGKSVNNITDQHVNDMIDEFTEEGMKGISARYIQDRIAETMVMDELEEPCVTWFVVRKSLEEGLKYHSTLSSSTKEDLVKFKALLVEVDKEYQSTVCDEVEKVIAGDDKEVEELFGKYIDHVLAYGNEGQVKDSVTGEMVPPDEDFMQAIEKEAGVNPASRDEHRRRLAYNISRIAREKGKFDFRSSESLYRALKKYIFKHKQDSIKLTSLRHGVVDEEDQKRIDVIKERLKKSYGYCDYCASKVLQWVASIFARGDSK